MAPSILPTQADIRSRVVRMQNAIKGAGMDLLVLHGTANHRFFTGLDGLPDVRPIFLVIRPNDAPAFISPRIEAPIICTKCTEEIVAEWGDWDEPGMYRSFGDALASYIQKLTPKAATIGLDSNTVTAANLELLKNKLASADIVDASTFISQVRRDGDAAQTGILRSCADVAAHKFKGAREATAPGVPEWKVALRGYTAAVERASKYLEGDENHSPLGSSFTVVGSGRIRSAHAHSVASNRIMRDGELVQICCCTPTLVGHDMCFDRPIAVGPKELPEDVLKVVNAAREASAAAWKVVRAGVRAGEVHAAAAEVIARHGFTEGMQHGTGRSIGCGGVGFRIMEGEQTVLQEGDVVGIEPGVYQYGVGGARYGDTALVTTTGCEMLTPFDLGRDIQADQAAIRRLQGAKI
ncbi:putative Xaa-Pro aminopeptidase P [Fusarium sp. Ph1]|nr:putative Xaa-Pro aminopeptidase P [Fusarium sp. Ph1]